MSRIQSMTKEKAKPETQEIYQTIEKNLGKLPNIFVNMGNSPAVLKGYLALNDAVSQTSIHPKIREKIALIVAQINQCNYCLSAHTAIAHGGGVTEEEMIQARKGESKDPKTKAILTFAKTVIDKRGHVSDQDVTTLKAAGVTDTELVEIILIININMFTNYFNHITDPKVDFPAAPKL